MKIVFFEMNGDEEEFIKKHVRDEIITTKEKLSLSNVDKYKDADIISIFIYSKAKKNVLEHFTHLKAILTRSTGTDHIDTEYCRNKGIIVKNVPQYGENTVAEFAFGLLLSISRRIYETVSETKEGVFELHRGFDLKGKTIGIIGTGSIGRQAIRIANGFQMKVIAYDKFPKKALEKELNFKYVNLNDLIKESDIISLHIPLLKETKGIINMSRVKKMKKGVIIINTARGGLIQGDALLYGLENKIISYAGLDVLESEHKIMQLMKLEQIEDLSKEELQTLIKDYNILKHPRVIFTPHNAFNTLEANQRILLKTIENLEEVKKQKS